MERIIIEKWSKISLLLLLLSSDECIYWGIVKKAIMNIIEINEFS